MNLKSVLPFQTINSSLVQVLDLDYILKAIKTKKVSLFRREPSRKKEACHEHLCFLRHRNDSISFSFHPKLSFFTTTFPPPFVYIDTPPICLRLTDLFCRTFWLSVLLMSPALFFRDQTLLLKPLFPPSVALTFTFFLRADTYEQSDVLTRMVPKKERREQRRILIRGDGNGNTHVGSEGRGNS